MRRAVAVLGLAVMMGMAASAQAQNDAYRGWRARGVQSIEISPGAFLPLFILDTDFSLADTTNLSPGATFSVRYEYLLSRSLGVGAAMAGAFASTIGGRTLFMAPVTGTVYWHGGSDALEFLAGGEVGFNVMRLSGKGLLSPIEKLGGGIARTISDNWSIGGRILYWFAPELHTGTYAGLTMYGNFLEISFGARYHF